jgi:hypothetical protein
MKEIILDQGFTSDVNLVSRGKITLDQEDINLIRQSKAFLEKLPVRSSGSHVELACWGFELLDDDQWRVDYSAIRVFKDSIYLYCQNKYDASLQWESGCLEFEALETFILSGDELLNKATDWEDND